MDDLIIIKDALNGLLVYDKCADSMIYNMYKEIEKEVEDRKALGLDKDPHCHLS